MLLATGLPPIPNSDEVEGWVTVIQKYWPSFLLALVVYFLGSWQFMWKLWKWKKKEIRKQYEGDLKAKGVEIEQLKHDLKAKDIKIEDLEFRLKVLPGQSVIISLTEDLRTDKKLTELMLVQLRKYEVTFIEDVVAAGTDVNTYMNLFTDRVQDYSAYIAVVGPKSEPERPELGRRLWEAECEYALAKELRSGLVIHGQPQDNEPRVNALADRLKLRRPGTAGYYSEDVELLAQLANVADMVMTARHAPPHAAGAQTESRAVNGGRIAA